MKKNYIKDFKLSNSWEYYLHGVFFAFELTLDEFHGRFGDIVPQIAALFDAGSSGVGERVAFAQLQFVARPVEGHHFVDGRRVCTTLPRYV